MTLNNGKHLNIDKRIVIASGIGKRLKLKEIAEKYEMLQEKMEQPETYSDPVMCAKISKEIRELKPVTEAYYRQCKFEKMTGTRDYREYYDFACRFVELNPTKKNYDYSCYYNDNKGKAHGIELSHSMNWRKFDLDIKGTYTDLKLQRRDSAVGYYGYHEVWPTYQPKYEANVRFTFKPTQKLSTFLEMHYTDQYFTFYSKGSGGKDAYLAGKPVSDLMVLNAGIKLQPTKRWQINLGCNDVFNSGPRQKIYSGTYGYGFGYINSEYPLQGRTYYGTVRYSFQEEIMKKSKKLAILATVIGLSCGAVGAEAANLVGIVNTDASKYRIPSNWTK